MSTWQWIIKITEAHDWGSHDPEVTGELVAYLTPAEGSDPPALPRAGQRFKLVPDDEEEENSL